MLFFISSFFFSLSFSLLAVNDVDSREQPSASLSDSLLPLRDLVVFIFYFVYRRRRVTGLLNLRENVVLLFRPVRSNKV